MSRRIVSQKLKNKCNEIMSAGFVKDKSNCFSNIFDFLEDKTSLFVKMMNNYKNRGKNNG